MSFSWQRGPQKNSIYELSLHGCVCVCKCVCLYVCVCVLARTWRYIWHAQEIRKAMVGSGGRG